ncbi:M17 family peptidase N-terminal domain-containing protein [Novosphingobium rosa]|uniref:M17 family peptidase N-terminal domain-containing protein n=1 Tax=Novosphingobium rosa TaxID=76978 RepID=UPI0008307B62|nr:M17 family peptidase N-terminal domain-containing protein [Novosphingobium rosa]
MTQVQTLGTYRNVAVDVAGWDSTAATVDLSCACMFSHEAHGATLGGGLAHLDDALGGTLTAMRKDGLFRAERGESLFLSAPPASVAAKALLVIGLGAPEDWSPAVMESAVRQAVGAAFFRPVRSIALAASMLDGGLTPAETAGASSAMLRGLTTALDAAAHLRAMNFVEPLTLTRWVFDVGIARFDAAAAQFRAELAAPSTSTD